MRTSRVLVALATAGVGGVASCGGVQVEDPEQAGTAGQPGGSAGRGGTTDAMSGGMSSSSTGGRTGGTGGRGTPVAGKGGGSAAGGRDAGGVAGREAMGQAGELEPGGAGGAGDDGPVCPGSSSYEPEVSGVICQDWWTYSLGKVVVKVESATNLEQCKAACDARPDCTAVNEFFDRRSDYGCSVGTTACDPVEPVWAKEDAGLEYVRVCPATGDCYLDFLGWGVRCAENGSTMRIPGATSVADCARACFDDPSCVSVIDYSYLNDFVGCFLSVVPCDPRSVTYDEGSLYVKACD